MSAPASPTDVSTFEGLRHSLYRRLLESVEHSATNKRFFPCSTGAAVLKSVDLRQIFDFVVAAAPGIQLTGDQFADRVQARKLHTFLAVLIYSQSTIRAVLSFATCLVVPDQWPRQLGVLPISREDARTVLNDDVAADNFCKNQDEFCAVIIQQNQEVVCDGQRLLPYLSEEHLGTGAFGRVYKIEVAPYHFVSRDGLLNQEKYPMARKDYILDEGVAHKRERDFMREILRNPKKHDNILKNLGSLQTGSTYSVFMELADHDLWDYMTVHHPDGPTTLKQKADLLYCATELAAALAHLHDDILTETFEKLSCFHLDLKPRNILVVTEEDQNTHQFVQRWKLSDFNMSKAKAKHHAPYLQRSRTLPEKIYDFNELFRRRGPDSNDRTVTMPTVNPRGDGTYSAPEACIPGGQVQAESDTWSFGCVLCVVFSYLDSGARGVKEFGDRRSEMPKDQFFTMNGPNSRLSFAVERWMKELRDRAYRRSKDEGVIVNDFLAFLHNKVLVVDTKKRKETRAKDIAKYLGEIYREYAKLAKHYPNEPSPSPSNPNPRSHRRTFSLPFSRRRSAPAQTQMGPPNPSTWKIPLPDSMKASFCEFGPNGDILVYVSGSTLVAYSPRVVLDTGDVDHLIEFGREHLTPKGYGWSTVAASSQYIVAASNQPLFDVSIALTLAIYL
jgi:serine/threonine protein kinase